jgi:hypothetical protein
MTGAQPEAGPIVISENCCFPDRTLGVTYLVNINLFILFELILIIDMSSGRGIQLTLRRDGPLLSALALSPNTTRVGSNAHIQTLHNLARLQLPKEPLHTPPDLLILRHRRMDIPQQLPQLGARIKTSGVAAKKCRGYVALVRFPEQGSDGGLAEKELSVTWLWKAVLSRERENMVGYRAGR